MAWVVGAFIAISLAFGLWCREFHGDPESVRPAVVHAVAVLGPRFGWRPGGVVGFDDDSISFRFAVVMATCERFPVFRRGPAMPMMRIVDDEIYRAARRVASIRADRSWRLPG